MQTAEHFPDPVQVHLLNTAECYELGPQINDFDNAIFGPDFYCSYETIRPWVESGNLFSSVVCAEAVAGHRRILSAASLLITSRTSRDHLFAGRIRDYELTPWMLSPRRCEPVIYFAAIVGANSEHVRALYDSLCADAEPYLQAFGISVESVFSIAAGPAGLHHMAKGGFCVWEGGRYLNKYYFMTLQREAALAHVWRTLLAPREVRCEHPDHAEPESGAVIERLPATDLLPCRATDGLPPAPLAARASEAHEVEKRLALSKADRYRLFPHTLGQH
jgi:hypothetical protein